MGTTSTVSGMRWVALDSNLSGGVRELTDQTLHVSTREVVTVGQELRFELHDPTGKTVTSGVGRVALVSDDGIGLTLLSLGVDRNLIARLNGQRPAPPPLPTPATQPSIRERSTPSLETNEWALRAKAPPLPREEPTSVPPASSELQVEQLSFSDPGVIIGIDLGTTNTVAAYVKDGQPTVIPSRTGSAMTPSMITFDPTGQCYVGQRALDRQVMYPARTVHGSKRLLGRTFRQDIAQDLQTHFAYPLGRAENQRFGARLDEGVVSLDMVTARILDEVRSCAEEHLGQPVSAAVITVPAYFSDVQREAVRRAARAANIVVHRIVNEPTAAALAYGRKITAGGKLVVWDLGGGTFDCSVVSLGEDVEVLATGGDNFLGGADFDDLLAQYFLALFREHHGIELEPTLQQVARLRQAAETAKMVLSTEEEAAVEVAELTLEPQRNLVTTVTREQFGIVTQELVDRTVAITRQVLSSAGMTPSEVDDVVLVGGATRIFAIENAVQTLFARRPSKRINPDEAVALGAALLASDVGLGLELRDIIPMSVARGLPGARLEVLVPRYTRLPTEKQLVLDADLLGSVSIPLFQGDQETLLANEYLCTVVVEDRSLWNGGRVRIQVSFDEHCVMAIEASNADTGRSLPVQLDRSRQLVDVLRELGATRADGSLPPPPAPVGSLFKRLGRLLG